MNTLTQFLAGKRTYLVASIAIAYILYCQQTKQTPDETILGIFGALGLAALRAGIPATGGGTRPESNGSGYPFPPQTPRADTNGITRTFPCLLACLMVFGLTGCLNGRSSGPETLTRSHLQFERTKKKEALDLDSHKDVSVDKVERIAPDGSKVLIEGYKSRANDAALEASSRQFEAFTKFATAAQEKLNNGLMDLATRAERFFSAREVPANQREVVVVTNYVILPRSTTPEAVAVPMTLIPTPAPAPAASTNAPAK